jgi:hypothetical protein
MRAEAIAQGAELIEAERALDQGFREGYLDRERLKQLIDRAEAAKAGLRFVHLSRHLETTALLTQHQIAVYSQKRGYGSDPCASVPEGHNAAMWRKHNGCEDG